MATIRRLYRQGNSVVLSLPGWMLELAGLECGCEVLVEKVDGDKVLQVRRWNPPNGDEMPKNDGAASPYLSG